MPDYPSSAYLSAGTFVFQGEDRVISCGGFTCDSPGENCQEQAGEKYKIKMDKKITYGIIYFFFLIDCHYWSLTTGEWDEGGVPAPPLNSPRFNFYMAETQNLVWQTNYFSRVRQTFKCILFAGPRGRL